jgi:hypothetical protein
MKESTNPEHEQARADIAEQVAAFQAKGGKVCIIPIAPATNHNPLALSFNEGGKPKRNRSLRRD